MSFNVREQYRDLQAGHTALSIGRGASLAVGDNSILFVSLTGTKYTKYIYNQMIITLYRSFAYFVRPLQCSASCTSENRVLVSFDAFSPDKLFWVIYSMFFFLNKIFTSKPYLNLEQKNINWTPRNHHKAYSINYNRRKSEQIFLFLCTTLIVLPYIPKNRRGRPRW